MGVTTSVVTCLGLDFFIFVKRTNNILKKCENKFGVRSNRKIMRLSIMQKDNLCFSLCYRIPGFRV